MNNKAVRSWVMYDWANSAFATTILAAVMPIFYFDVASKGLNPATSTAYWGYTQSIALIFVVILSPILGAIADASSSKKQFLRFFTYMGVLSSLLMFTIGEGEWLWASVLVILGTLAFSGGNVFYDAFLTDIAPEEKRDMVSSRGYAFGYIGGGILLAINLAMITYHDSFSLSKLAATQISFLSVGLWWFFFSLPLFRNVHEKKRDNGIKQTPMSQILNGFRSVAKTIKEIRKYPELLKFLIAYWFFSDGINTIIKMATIYGREIGIEQTDLIAALLITQFVGFPCTLLFGKVAEKVGSKNTLLITLVFYLVIVSLGFFMTSSFHFYLLAIMVGLVQGGSQAISRSIFSRMVPVHRNAEFFGFFGLSGKFASVFGPAVFGFAGQLMNSSRAGILSVAIFFIVGILLLLIVNPEKGKEQAMSGEQSDYGQSGAV
ncbi:MFS transporter [Paenactinomyces guangxiensis]|uniref:MFS transporter n=1 Tax=Paenactinomyces guangxiensis TaxID=1490290 RepID=A0A7W1WTM5_9BACL|nr:MFS transporter [Paenactinomyces guangxiensis]MBA4495778.1 MFS transporter [Paenactinomyces guangxiensis]MBH8592868.1 MFS transporter [Paenactinomyces guangxiensis]